MLVRAAIQREAERGGNGQQGHDGDDNLAIRNDGLDEDGLSDGHEAGIKTITLLVGLKYPKLHSGSCSSTCSSRLAEESTACNVLIKAFSKGLLHFIKHEVSFSIYCQ